MSSASTASSGIGTRSKARITAVLFVFAVWFVIILLRLSQYMVFERDRHLAAMTRTSIVEGTIPARRGRLLDRNGVPLAWTARRFSVTWHVPGTAQATREALARIDAELPRREVDDATLMQRLGSSLVLCRDLSALEAAALEPLSESVAGLKLSSYFVRHHYPDRGLDRYLGQVAETEGTEVGVSGLELTHDAFLRGRPGAFRVMVDKRGRWIPETWEKVREMRPGYDVYIPVRAEALAGRGS